MSGGYQKALPFPSPSKNGKITGKQVLSRPEPMTSASYEGFRVIYLMLLVQQLQTWSWDAGLHVLLSEVVSSTSMRATGEAEDFLSFGCPEIVGALWEQEP